MKKNALFLTLIFSLAPAVSDASPLTESSNNTAQVALGKFLFFDKILSGNKNISCATCHHPLAATGDGLSLPVGEGGRGLGVTRDTGSGVEAIHERVPRNAPPVFNLGHVQFKRMFFDGRVSKNPNQPSGYDSPAGDQLPLGLDSTLAAQAMFPVTSAIEMAGQASENPVADAAAAQNLTRVWNLLTKRLMNIPEYVDLFRAAYPGVDVPTDISFVHVANAIAAFEASAYAAGSSPFDRYLRGDKGAISSNAKMGWQLFQGKAGCINCHSGRFQTDQDFHAIGIPQIGPGKGDGYQGLDDYGRERVTGSSADRYRFRTPSLRNVAITGPWGHDGAYNTLLAVVKHHLHPHAALRNYDRTQVVLPRRSDLDALDFVIYDHQPSREALAANVDLVPVQLTSVEIKQLLEFLQTLTDPKSLDLRNTVPSNVPSGLRLAD